MQIKPILVALTATAATAGTLAISASGQSDSSGPMTLTVRPATGKAIDLGAKGVSVGDEFLESGTLRTSAGAPGRFHMVTQLVAGNARRGSEHTTFILDLAGGQIVVVGEHATTSRFTLPVVGGTGSYAAAAGTMTVAPGGGEAERLTLTLGAAATSGSR